MWRNRLFRCETRQTRKTDKNLTKLFGALFAGKLRQSIGKLSTRYESGFLLIKNAENGCDLIALLWRKILLELESECAMELAYLRLPVPQMNQLEEIEELQQLS